MGWFNPSTYDDEIKDKHEEMWLEWAMNILKSSYEAKRENIIKGFKDVLLILLEEGEFSDKQKVESELVKTLQRSVENNVASIGTIKDLIANTLKEKDEETYKRYISAPLTAEELNKRYLDYVITKDIKDFSSLLPLIVSEIEPEFQDKFKAELGEFRLYVWEKLSKWETLYAAVADFVEWIKEKNISVSDAEEDRFHRIAQIMYKGKEDGPAQQDS